MNEGGSAICTGANAKRDVARQKTGDRRQYSIYIGWGSDRDSRGQLVKEPEKDRHKKWLTGWSFPLECGDLGLEVALTGESGFCRMGSS